MIRRVTTAPPKGPEAFAKDSDIWAQAQAAILLGMGVQLRGDDIKTAARSEAAGFQVETLGVAADVAPAAGDAASSDEFPIPRLAPTGERVSLEVARSVAERVTNTTFDLTAASPENRAVLAERVYSEPTPANAAALIQASLHHPDPLVRVAAAAAALPLSSDVEAAVEMLRTGTHNRDPLVREVAATALARFSPEDSALRRLRTPRGADLKRNDALELAAASQRIIVHGTWATNNAWWQPGGDFYTFLDASLWNPLYRGTDHRWSGGYSDDARAAGAKRLAKWASSHGPAGPSLICHSHGASVAMLASWDDAGVTFDKLRFMSAPVHPSKYKVNFARVGSVSSVRVRLDLVLLADGGGSRFTDPRYDDHTLPIWFNHSATHDPKVWQKYGVAGLLKM
jgi:hypothetical protein